MPGEFSQIASIDESVRRRFESARQSGSGAPLASFLPPPADAHYLATLEELVLIELEFSWKQSRQPMSPEGGAAPRPKVAADFLGEFPELNHPSILARILKQEEELRRRFGDEATLQNFAAHSPQADETLEWRKGSSSSTAKPAPLPQIPGYEMLEMVGRGGMGLVLKARHKLLGRLVAIKLPLAQRQMDDQDRERFLREARTAASLRHSHICPLFEVGEHEGRPYIVMGFIQGETLDAWAKRTAPSAHRSAEILAKLARAVAYAHAHGVVHRDLKPSNAMIDSETGEPVLMDFGLAKQLSDEESNLTQSGQIVGTPAYMSPEQAFGKARETGPLSDVYSLGAILYQQLCGGPPFSGGVTEVLHAVAHDEPPSPAKVAPRTHRDLVTICLKAMAKEPGRRYSTALALAEDLERFCAGEAILARRESAVFRVWRNVRKRPVAALLTVGIIVALAMLGWESYRAVEQSHRRAHIGELADSIRNDLEQLQLTETSLQAVEQKITLLRELAPDQAAAEADRLHGRLADQIQAAIRQRLGDADDRGIENAIRLLAERDPQRVGELQAEMEGRRRRLWKPLFAWSSPFTQVPPELAGGVAQVGNSRLARSAMNDKPITQSSLVALQAASPGSVQLRAEFAPGWDQGPEIGLLLNYRRGNSGPINCLSFHPQGDRIATAANELLVWELATGRVLFTFQREKPAPMCAAFHPQTGQLAAASSGENLVWLLNPLTGAMEKQFTAHEFGVGCLAFDASGKWLATGGGQAGKTGEVKLWNAADWSLRDTFSLHADMVRHVAISPDGKWLASGGSDNEVQVVDLAARKAVFSSKGDQLDHSPDVTFGADSRRLAFQTYVDHKTVKAGGFNTYAGILDMETLQAAPIIGGGLAAGISSLAFAPSGNELAIASAWGNHVRLCDVRTYQIRGFLTRVAPRAEKLTVRYSPDGALLAIGAADSVVRIFDVASGLLRQTLENAGYEFNLQARAVRAAPGGEEAPLAASIAAQRAAGADLRLLILRDGVVLRDKAVRPSQLPAGPLRLSASREANRLTFRVNDLEPLEFEDLFPKNAAEAGVFALRWPVGVSLESLTASQQALPARPAPLEVGDELFSRGELAAALRSYQEQIIAAPGGEAEQESLVKSALCQLAQHHDDEALQLLEKVASGAGSRWPVVAGCQLWIIYLRAGRMEEADDVFETLSKRYSLAELVAIIPQGFRERILYGYVEAVHQRNIWLKPDPKRLRMLERAVAIHEYFQTSWLDRRETLLALIRANHLEGRQDRAIALAKELLAQNHYWEGQEPQRAFLAFELSWLLRQKGLPAEALQALDRWGTGAAEKEWPIWGFLRLERARVMAAQGDAAGAERMLDEFVKDFPPPLTHYEHYAAACLARGLLREARGDQAGALAAWSQGRLDAFQQNETLNLGHSLAGAAGNQLMYALPLATYTGSLTDEDARRIGEGIFSRVQNSSLLATASSVIKLPPTQVRDMWKSRRGRECARQLAWLDLSAAEFYRLPFVLAAYDTVLQSVFAGEVSAEQDALLWKMVEDGYMQYAAGKIAMPQLLCLGFAWKGVSGSLGWGGVKDSLNPTLRGPLAYIFGRRYLRLNQREKAISFFQLAVADAPVKSPLQTLAQTELDQLRAADKK